MCLSLHRGRDSLEGILAVSIQYDDRFKREIRPHMSRFRGNRIVVRRSPLEPGPVVAIDDREPRVDDSAGFNLNARCYLEVPTVVRGDNDQQFMVPWGQPGQGHRTGESAMISIRVLAVSLGDIRAEHAVIDSPASFSVDEGLDSLDARGSKGPAVDDDGFAWEENRAAVGSVEATDDPPQLEGVIVDLERCRELGPCAICSGNADGYVVHAVRQIADADLPEKSTVCAGGKPRIECRRIRACISIRHRSSRVPIDQYLDGGIARIG